MVLLNTVDPKNAQGVVKESYAFFNELAGMVPRPVEMMSASPDLLSIHIDTVKYYLNKSNLSFSLLAYIRLLVAVEEHYPYCVNLNQKILMNMGGVSKKEIDAAMEDETLASLESNEVELLEFVLKVIKDPTTTEKSDIHRLHGLGWTDRDIYDAVNEGLLMVIRGMAFKAFKMSG